MKPRDGVQADSAELRARAEDRLKDKPSKAQARRRGRAEETKRLVHELQVHQIELELQNEELRETREELEAGLQRYSDLYDFAPIGYLTLDSDGAIRKANLTGARLLGTERARLVGARLGFFVSAECRPIFNGFLEQVFQRQGKQICEVALCRELSPALWVHIEAAPSGEDGIECGAVLTDISERKRAETIRQESEARIRAIYDHLPNPTLVWQHHATGFILTAFNEAARAATNGGLSSFMGRSAAELPCGIPDLAADIERCFAQRVSIRRELDFASLAWQTSGRLVATYGFVPPDMVLLHTEDVTEQRQNEEQLRVAQRMEAVGQLAGGIAHDFNNLLTVIVNYTTFAMEAVGERDPLRADLVEIHKAGVRATALTRQLLAFGRRQVLQPQVLDLNKIVKGMEAMLRRLLGEDIDLSVALAMDLGMVMADPGQIERVVMNLAVNARDAMPDGGKLTIETADLDIDEACASQQTGVNPGSYVTLSVTDTGCGMDEKTRARLFEPFFTTKRTGTGAGLGLATSYGIVKQSGGSICVHSEPTRGSTFKVYLPRELSARETVERAPPITSRASGTETILVVEDEEAVRNLAGRILSEVGYTVLAAANGHEALLICERHQEAISLVLTDIIMPQMGGKQLAEHLARLYPNLRVLFMSGYTDDAIVKHGVLDEGTHFIGKPFSPADLTRMVRRVLDSETTSAPPCKESSRSWLSDKSP
jgi:two-component system, cell cycle sensor histidine kinase and response regulator CckA